MVVSSLSSMLSAQSKARRYRAGPSIVSLPCVPTNQIACQPALLQPSLGSGDSCRFHSVACAQFADGFGEVVADGAVGEVELRGDVTAGQAFAGEAQDLAFAVGEGSEVGAAFGGELGMDHAQALVDAANGVGKFFGAHVF